MTSVSGTVPVRQTRFPRRTMLFAAAVLLLHFIAAQALDAAGLVESLLSPNGDRLLWVLPLAILLYTLRFAVYFVIPGLVVGSLLGWRRDASRARHTNEEQTAPLSRSE